MKGVGGGEAVVQPGRRRSGQVRRLWEAGWEELGERQVYQPEAWLRAALGLS